MRNAAQLRHQIEAALSDRIPVALTPQLRPELDRTACGVSALDDLLHGGLPAGVLTELVGSECSGRTSAGMAYMAALTNDGGVCAWVDVADALDPESAAANGVDLARFLWVRCGPAQTITTTKPIQVQRPSHGCDTSRLAPQADRHTGGGSPHPRSEGRDMPAAIEAVLGAHGGLYDRQIRREKKMIGTPGAANRPLSVRSELREEQVNSDRLPPRRGGNLVLAPRGSESQSGLLRRKAAEPGSGLQTIAALPQTASGRSVQSLDQALRATDLLLQGGGFGAIVLDLGSVPPEIAWRIPLATWFRFRAACERTRVSLLLLTQHPCTRSSAELVVRLETGSLTASSKVMTGVRFSAAVERNRSQSRSEQVVSIRKPPRSTGAVSWQSEASWAKVR